MSDNKPTITASPTYSEHAFTWYDTLNGTFFKENKETGTDGNDSMVTTNVLFRVPEAHTATLDIKLSVDDWGKLTVTDKENKQWLSLSLTDKDEDAGPRGGHTYWSKQGTVMLPEGDYTIQVEQTNTTYPEQYDPKFNVSRCDFSITATKEPKSLKLLTADEYGEIGKTGTDCKAYIKSNDKLNAQEHHAISVGLEYNGPSPDAAFDGTPESSREGKDTFKPERVELSSDGKAKFKVWTEEPQGKPEIKLNGAIASVSYLPAVFEDLFKVTIYYTPRESGFKVDATPVTKECRVGDSKSEITVEIRNLRKDFLRAVEMEGFGHMATNYTDKKGEVYPYIAYDSGTWYVSKVIYGKFNRVLTDKGSCAGGKSQFKPGRSKIKLDLNDDIKSRFGTDTFTVDDVGEAVGMNHIDLYWGEDDPLNGSPTTGLPAGLKNGLPKEPVFRCMLIEE